ncbi:MAG TPA: anti-sigma factor [Gaiellaceae bacterium]|nr:anti-sigma factor [Gaiellaceae bacterium]
MTDRFDELVGEIDDQRERERLRRVHALLLSVDAPPELSPASPPEPAAVPRERRRGRVLALLAAALTAAAFGAGYLVGGRDAAPDRVITMEGAGAERDATASIEVLEQDGAGNWPMRVLVRGLEPSRDRSDFYELWLTANGRRIASCGRFVVAGGVTTVTLSVPYGLRSYDGWIVTRAGSDEILLTT